MNRPAVKKICYLATAWLANYGVSKCTQLNSVNLNCLKRRPGMTVVNLYVKDEELIHVVAGQLSVT